MCASLQNNDQCWSMHSRRQNRLEGTLVAAHSTFGSDVFSGMCLALSHVFGSEGLFLQMPFGVALGRVTRQNARVSIPVHCLV